VTRLSGIITPESVHMGMLQFCPGPFLIWQAWYEATMHVAAEVQPHPLKQTNWATAPPTHSWAIGLLGYK